MKNLKTKILFLLSIVLILGLSSICYAQSNKCSKSPSMKHIYAKQISAKHENNQRIRTMQCEFCTSTTEIVDENHELKYSSWLSNTTIHYKKIECTACDYNPSTSAAKHTFGDDGACSVCGYVKKTTGSTCVALLEFGTHIPLSGTSKTYYDASNHWTESTCSYCGTKYRTMDKGVHSFGLPIYTTYNADKHKVTRKCKICGYEKIFDYKAHNFKTDADYSFDSKKHYKKSTCTDCNLIKTTKAGDHVFSTDLSWSYDSTNHWQNGVCDVCNEYIEKFNFNKHSFDANNKCSCGMTQAGGTNVKEKVTLGKKNIRVCRESDGASCADLTAPVFNPADTANKTLTWSSSDSTVLAINNGCIDIIKDGTVTLTAKTINGSTDTCRVQVYNGHTSNASKKEYEERNKEQHYIYSVCDICSKRMSGFVLANHNFVNGVCSICKATQESTDDNTEKEAIIPTSIKFGRKETTICLECTPTAFSLVNGYTFTPTGVTEKGLVWTTNNSSVLNVSGTTITPEKIGKATLTAKSTAANSVSATCTVNIVAHKLKEEIKTDYDKNNHWTVGRCGYCGKNQKFNIQAHTFENGKCKYCPATKSSNTCVHEIDETTATIQYDANKHWQNGECVFCGKVFDDTDKFAAKSHTYGTVLEWESDTTYHWKEFSCTKCKYVKIEHKAKHTISAGSWEWKYNSRGESMHYKKGKCTKCQKTDLYAVRPTLCSYENGKCTVCNRKQSDETAVTEPVLQKISIVGGTNKTCVLGNIKLGDIKAEPAEAKIGNITWSSSNTSIIVIQNENYAMAVGTPGKSILTVKTETGITATYLVTVVNHEYDSNGKCKYCGNVKLTDKPLELTEPVEPAKEILPKEITFNRTSALLCLNHGNSKSKIECTMIAVPKILPENATNQDLTWSSSDSSILEIDGACVVAKQKGKVTLTAKTSNGLTATCNIEVVDHKKAQEMEYDYNGTNHWKYGICGNSLEDIYNTNEEKHTFVNGVCKCGKRASIVSGENILTGYEDVKRSDWYQESIEYVTEKKLMNGMGDEKFNPNGSMTRGMLVTVLYRMSRSTYAGKSEFIDVSEFEYYSTAVAWATENEIVKGVGNNSFAPDDEVTREQLITILYRYAKYTNRTVRIIKKSNISEFEDYIEISEYSLEAFEWGYGEKIISGRSNTTLNPKGTASRAEVATMLMRFEGEK